MSLAVLSSEVRLHDTRTRVIKETRISAEEVAHAIAEDLKADRTSADDAADSRVLKKKMLGYISRQSRIVQLGLTRFGPRRRRRAASWPRATARR